MKDHVSVLLPSGSGLTIISAAANEYPKSWPPSDQVTPSAGGAADEL